jgi:hypothetical protein
MAEMDVMGDLPTAKHGGKTKGEHHRRARGGSTTATAPKQTKSANVYNAAGSPEMAEATERKPGFKGGGKLKDGGNAHGEMAHGRHDRHQRGGATRTPYSTGSQLSPPIDDRKGRGYEGNSAA